MAPGGIINLVVVLFLIVWLYATLMLAERRSGYIILVASLFASGMPIVHMMGAGLAGGKIADSSGAFFFVWVLIALGVTALFSAILSACGLWRLQRGPKKQLSP
jgi:hypothetical protein